MPAWAGKGESAWGVLAGLAKNIGVDITGCNNDTAVQAEINADQAEGAKYGVSGTPALFIGSQVMPGAISAEAFAAAVNKELAAQ